MIRYFELAIVFGLIFTGFLLLELRTDMNSRIKNMLHMVRSDVEQKDRQIRLERRRQLFDFEKKISGWLWLERELEYSGLRRRIKGLSVGKFLIGNVVMSSIFMGAGILIKDWMVGLCFVLLMLFAEIILIQIMKSRNFSIVNEELPKFLDFLGNYSLSSGELVSIISQISVYMRYPLGEVLEECEVESKLSGDTCAALLAMADKIEHPQFKQLVVNLEVSSRYSADFSNLVVNSRRSLREYIAQSNERKGMLREAVINMGLLMIMSIVVLLTVNMLVDVSIWQILFFSFVGRLALAGMILILILFSFQGMGMSK